ncbi:MULTISPECIES: hypothetical protein [unclassified Pseudomonas]|uniref:hypothetical protein n=1 Tax=unclassified Pseudomonas TaxID=196821 RepID=UPI0020975B9F|nr:MULTISPECIES: hypothetical protein [unclassified Pseudomonas]MCO7506780.1 hypothetical protein [Pseudomonas sp. VE 267-6A]MCO7531476.1 hypothetical protein [Pseudomonas sp. 2]
MTDERFITADAIELLLMNQTAIRAAIEELSLWVSQRGSTQVHDNVLVALQSLDVNAEGLGRLIASLRDQLNDKHEGV